MNTEKKGIYTQAIDFLEEKLNRWGRIVGPVVLLLWALNWCGRLELWQTMGIAILGGIVLGTLDLLLTWIINSRKKI